MYDSLLYLYFLRCVILCQLCISFLLMYPWMQYKLVQLLQLVVQSIKLLLIFQWVLFPLLLYFVACNTVYWTVLACILSGHFYFLDSLVPLLCEVLLAIIHPTLRSIFKLAYLHFLSSMRNCNLFMWWFSFALIWVCIDVEHRRLFYLLISNEFVFAGRT